MPLRGISNDFRNNIGFHVFNSDLKPKFNAFSAKSMFSFENYVKDEDLVEGEDYEIVRIEDSKTVEKPFKSAIDGFFKTKKDDTLDGTIGETSQHSTGDCWLLSGVNSMSYTEKGREILKNAIKPCDDGGVIVELKGANNYYISPKAINQASTSPYYSSGDLDMICIELAIEGARNDAASGNLITPDDSPRYIPDENTKASTTGKSSINGGIHDELIYFLTGKDSEQFNTPESIEENLSRLEENKNKTLASAIALYTQKDVKDYDGNDISLPGAHAYAVKSVDGDCVTITNPWNSGEDIKLKKDVFVNDVCDSLRISDLSDENEEKNYLFKADTSTEYHDGYSIQTGKDKNGIIRRIDELDNNGKPTDIKKYDADGKITSDNRYGYLQDGSLRYKSTSIYDENEILTQRNTSVFNTDETLEKDSVKYFFENGNVKENTRNEYENGEIAKKTNDKFDENNILTEETISTYYNEKLNITKKSVYDDKNNLIQTIQTGYKDGKLYEISTTDYDKNGNKTHLTRETYNENNSIANSRIEDYDENGLMTHSENSVYNSEGKAIISVQKDFKGKNVVNSTTYNYDKDGEIKFSQHSYIDDKGFKIVETDKNGDGVVDEVKQTKS